MANLKRYERHTWFDGDGDDFHNMRPASDGEWVKFEDVEEFLKTSNNSASPKPCDTCLHQCTYTCTQCSYFHVSLYKASGE